jgi:hypothetical protein
VQLLSRIEIYLPGAIVTRSPGLWDKVSALWRGAEIALVRDTIEATAFVFELRSALSAMQIDNAHTLVVDGVTVFRDMNDVEGDLPELFAALSDHISVFGESCRELRLILEHEEAGLELVIEASVASEHRRDAPSARISVLAAVADLSPRSGETAEVYRARVEPLVADPRRVAVLHAQFDAYVARLRSVLGHTFMSARIEHATETLELPSPTPRLAPSAPKKASPVESTATPARNFSLSLEERVGAILSGPPRYALRLRRLEELQTKIIGALRDEGIDRGDSIPIALAKSIEDLNRLIAEHNEYYPIERGLALDVATGELMEMGVRWRPKATMTLEALQRAARLLPA